VQAYWEANLAYCAEINPDYGKQGKARNVILLAFITGLGGVGTNLFAKDETWGFISIHLIFRVVSIIMGFLFRYFVEFHESKGLPVIS
jgi:hypothetical protein